MRVRQSFSRVVTFKASPELLNLIDTLAKKHNMTRSELIRTAVITLSKVIRYSPSLVEVDAREQYTIYLRRSQGVTQR